MLGLLALLDCCVQKPLGFTLIELMVTIAVLAIIASIAVPSFGNIINRQRLDLAARDFSLTFSEARGQAIGLRKDISIKLTCTTLPTLPCPNQSTTYYWLSPRTDIRLVSDPLDVIFTKDGLAKQRTKKIPNPDYDPNKVENLQKDPPENPKLIEQVVPLIFTLCNSSLKESRVISVAKTGTVDGISKGTCS